jgi:hypothetical protein
LLLKRTAGRKEIHKRSAVFVSFPNIWGLKLINDTPLKSRQEFEQLKKPKKTVIASEPLPTARERSNLAHYAQSFVRRSVPNLPEYDIK